MQAPRLVATDVDGTLLDPDGNVTARCAAAIGSLVAGGVGFVLVTGRPPRWIPPIVAQLGVVRLAVCANGAVLYDAVADEVLWARELPATTLEHVVGVAGEVLPAARIGVERVGRGAFDDAAAQFLAEPDYEHAWAADDSHRRDRADLLAHPAVKLLVRVPGVPSGEIAAVLTPRLGELVDITYSHSNGLIEVAPRGVTKATGLAEVTARLDIDAADVVAFGDMPNDLAMLCWAGHGVAMGNAHPALLEVADEVTAGNDADGVALVLERWL